MGLFHHHVWEILSEQKVESPRERMMARGNVSIQDAPRDIYFGTHILIVTCKCGKIKKFVTKV
jgi:hypothetical protein